MNPAYLLAYKLVIPVIVQPEWDECLGLLEKGWRLLKEGRELWDEGDKLWKEGRELRDEGDKLWKEGRELFEEGWKIWDEGYKLYQEAVARELGLEYTDRIDWDTGEVK